MSSTCNCTTFHGIPCESACCRGCERRLGLLSPLCVECGHDTAEAFTESIKRGSLPFFPGYDAGETMCTGCESEYVASSDEAESRWGSTIRDRRHGVCDTCTTRFELKSLTDCYKKCPSCAAPKPAGPRLIMAAEVLAELNELLNNGTYWPHDYNARCGVWVYCDCPKCRLYYDPTGEESAKYLNMDHESFFRGQSDQPSFAFSRLFRESYLAHSKPGFYVGKRRDCLSLDEVQAIAFQAPLILHISADRSWTEYIPSADETVWRRRIYKHGRSVWEKEEDRNVPADELLAYLAELDSQ